MWARLELAGAPNLASLVLILAVLLGFRAAKQTPFSLLPSAAPWKAACALAAVAALALTAANLAQPPVAKITGQPRSPFEIVDVILLAPIAEELIFRGLLWSLIEKIWPDGRWNLSALLATSLLFGVEHLGYWAQSYWPLPAQAFAHAAEMIAAGIAFGLLRRASRSLAAPTAVHFLANGLILLFQ